MLKRSDKHVQESAQQAALAQAENELATALSLQDNAQQASIWQYNAMGSTDAFIDRKRHAALIERLTRATAEADAIKAEADALVATLKEEKRALTRSLGAKVNDPQMKVERERAEAKVSENAKAQVKAEPPLGKQIVKIKPKTKAELIADTQKQLTKKQSKEAA